MISTVIAQRPDFIEIEKGLEGFRFSGTKIGGFINILIPVIFFGAGVLLLLYFISGGFTLMTSGGDPKKAAAGKEVLKNALLGFVIIFISFWVVEVVATLLGLNSILSIFSSAVPVCGPGGCISP